MTATEVMTPITPEGTGTRPRTGTGQGQAAGTLTAANTTPTPDPDPVDIDSDGTDDTTPSTSTTATSCCPSCGSSISLPNLPAFQQTQTALLSAQQQITELQSQIKLLNAKASAAVDRWADYEDELTKLRAQLSESRSSTSSTPTSPSASSPTSSPLPQKQSPQQQKQLATVVQQGSPLPTPPSSVTTGSALPSPSRTSFLASVMPSTTGVSSAATRISALLSSRKSTPNLKPLPSIPVSPRSPIPSVPPSASLYNLPSLSTPPASGSLRAEDLLSALNKEQARRMEVESRLSQTSKEVEELSVSLFEQANEMVASERRARAELEKRVVILEKRDVEKKKRLEVLERGVERIGRVRGVLEELDELDA
ncbi:hypothetical protein QBC40DRAFT_273179 [Triangularia verruculosa]|uniref:GDP/GTP exchange factor Sec2 N-terminal domain-containing protein n=1 Tax=Triangularia verruculosa TaxID=2587418 RepID=A0AAN6XPU5_9PEZI|nr:hypothetical protein QBC40DRAFT_273179 [Triangularia verruculosa]